jgi:hypothetical protein
LPIELLNFLTKVHDSRGATARRRPLLQLTLLGAPVVETATAANLGRRRGRPANQRSLRANVMDSEIPGIQRSSEDYLRGFGEFSAS